MCKTDGNRVLWAARPRSLAAVSLHEPDLNRLFVGGVAKGTEASPH